jgi:putative DNA primase/helicase
MTTAPAKPPLLTPIPDVIPRELRTRSQWVVWRLELVTDNRGREKWTKVPYNARTGAKASSTDGRTWAPFDAALDAYQRGGYDGLGFVLGADDPYAGIDLDHCLTSATSATTALLPWAAELVQRADSYTERTPGGEGVRTFLLGSLPPGARKVGHAEMYDRGRFLTVTGHHLDGTPTTIADRNSEIVGLHARLVELGNATKPQRPARREQGTKAQAASGAVLADEPVLKRMLAAKNGADIGELLAGRWEGAYESQSSADLALCSHLAFWTGGDAVQMDRLFRQSGLMRPKWDERRGDQTYGELTIGTALASASASYSGRHNGASAGDGGPGQPQPDAVMDRSDPPHLTDQGNAQRLVKRFGELIRYCEPLGGWYVWDAKRWKLDATGTVERYAKRIALDLYHEAADIEDDKLRDAYLKHAKSSNSARGIAAMLRLAQSEPGIPVEPDAFDRDVWLFNVTNGTLNLRTGALQPHRKEDLITRLAATHYDPEATCPRWRSFLARVMDSRPGLIAFLRRLIGYSLIGITAEEMIAILYGSGRNGKSKFLEAIREVLGDYAAQCPFETFLHSDRDAIRNDLARLAGIRFVSASEADEGRRLSESVIKQVTGGVVVAARFLHHEFFEYRPQYTILLATNHKPRIRGTDEGIWSRVRLVPFSVFLPAAERDKHLLDKLRAEAAGILAWAIQGCLDWQRVGLDEPDEVIEATDQYRAEQDVLSDFLTTCCIASPTAVAPATDLYNAFLQYTGEQGISQTAFGRKLSEKGFTRERSSATGRMQWRGVGLLTRAGDAPPAGAGLNGFDPDEEVF